MRLHDRYGLNPTVPLCWLCQQAKNEVVLVGAASPREMPPQTLLDGDLEPCDECKKMAALGVILVSVRDADAAAANTLEPDASGRVHTPNPYRTGGWIVVTKQCVERLFRHLVKPEHYDETMKLLERRRWAFVPDSLWDACGLPRGAVEGVPGSVEEYEKSKGGSDGSQQA